MVNTELKNIHVDFAFLQHLVQDLKGKKWKQLAHANRSDRFSAKFSELRL